MLHLVAVQECMVKFKIAVALASFQLIKGLVESTSPFLGKAICVQGDERGIRGMDARIPNVIASRGREVESILS